MKLSACVIIKNEEKNMPRWLATMKKIAKEIIVVDTGSTDHSISIAKEAGAKVFQHEWKNDFAAAKNYAIEQATGDWILFLDADEYFTDKCIKSIPLHIAKYQRQKHIDAIACRIINIDTDVKGRIISTFSNVRIFRNVDYLRYKNNVHEYLYSKIGELGLCMLDKEIDIYHTGYASSIINHKLQRNLQLIQEDIALHGEKPEHYHYLCDCYHGLKDYEKTVEYAQKHLASGHYIIGGEHELYKCLIDGMIMIGKSESEVMETIALAKQKYPAEATFWFCEGDFLMQKRKYDDAESALQKALEVDGTAAEEKYLADMFILYRIETYYDLAQIKVIKGDNNTALQYLLEGLQINPYHNEVFLAFVKLLENADAVEVIQILNHLYQTDKVDDLMFLLNNLKKMQPNQVELYYTNLARKKGIPIQEDRAREFCSMGNYEAAANVLTGEIENAYLDLILACVGSRDEKLLQTGAVLLPPMYQNVLQQCIKPNKILNETEKMLYNKVMDYAKRLGIELK